MIQLDEWFHKYNAWSFTRHRLWAECKRAYYYRYIGAALREAIDFDIRQIKQLKRLKSRFVLQGSLIHQVLENQIGQFHLGRSMNEEAARNQYVNLIEQSRRDAKCQLVEYYNGEAVDQAFFDRIRENGLDQISMFFGVVWLQLSDLEYLRHEKFDRMKVGDVEGIVKVDYVSKTQDGKIVISDWKTGADNEEYESDLQIGTYVLWATQYYDVDPAQIRSELVYLTTGSMHAHEFGNEQLQEIKQLILSEYGEMNRAYDMEYFEPDPDARKCKSCPFATMCDHSLAETSQ